MDKFTEVRQSLGRSIFALLKKYNDRLTVTLEFQHKMYFYARHIGADEKYTVEMGWFYDNGDGLMAVRTTFRGPEDAVSQRTTVEDMEQAMSYMPVVEKFLEVEAERAGIETA